MFVAYKLVRVLPRSFLVEATIKIDRKLQQKIDFLLIINVITTSSPRRPNSLKHKNEIIKQEIVGFLSQ